VIGYGQGLASLPPKKSSISYGYAANAQIAGTDIELMLFL